uniref:Complement component 8, gamma polypeptide n=1 Tax=Lepisosteus oculatus TaxID=7918 RepID=W5M6B1_LEPOC
MAGVRAACCVFVLAVWALCLPDTGGAARPSRRRQQESPIDKIAVQEDFNLDQMSGKWFLIGVASECESLRQSNAVLEGTTITLKVPPKSPQTSAKSLLSVSTLRKLDLQCWDIRQEYHLTPTKGRFLLKGPGTSNNIDIVVAKTDYRGYAILYYQKRGKITIKLYGRSTEIPEDILNMYEDLAQDQKISIDSVYYFPKYGFCESADEFHILPEAPTA